MRTHTPDERTNIDRAELGIYPIIEITDPDSGWRDMSAALHGPDFLNHASLSEHLDGNTQAFALSLARDHNGFQMLSNPEFAGGSDAGYATYDNGASGSITRSLELDPRQANRSGYRMKLVHSTAGSPSPGWGGFSRGIVKDDGTYRPDRYHEGDTIVWRLLLEIPVGYTVTFASNAYGTGGTVTELTSMAGTGAPFEYVWKQIIGVGGSFSSTGFWYISGSTRPVTWYAYRVNAFTENAPISLSPLRVDSAINRNAAGAFAPILDLHRKWRVRVAIVPAGSRPVAADYKPLGEGYVDSIDVNESGDIAVVGRDLGGILIDAFIRTKRTYGGPGVSLETVFQAIINDNATDNGYSGITAYFPVATSIVIDPPYLLGEGSVMHALTQLVEKFGYVFRYRYDAADVLRPTVYKPNRVQTVQDFSLAPGKYLSLPVMRLDKSGIRNLVIGRYWDTAAGAVLTVISPSSGTSASITKYGLRPMPQDLSSDTLVNTNTRAVAIFDAIRQDLENPALEQEIETIGLWIAQLSDYVKTEANDVHYDTDQLGAIKEIAHTITGGTMRTRLGLSGKPAGRYRTWLLDSETMGGPLVCPAIFLSEKIVGGPPRLTLYRLIISFTPPPSPDYDYMEFEVISDSAGDVSAVASNAKESPAVVNVQPDVTYTVKPFVVSLNGDRIAGTQVALHISNSLHVGPTRLVLPVGVDLWAT